MSWIELSLNATHEAVDWVCTLLADVGYIGDIQITNYRQTDRATSHENDWAFTICLYLSNEVGANSQLEKIADLLSPLHRTGLTTALEVATIEEKPVKRRDRTHRIGQRFVVLAPDTRYQPQPNDILLKLETSLSFGSGFHPATRLSLELLERHVRPAMHVLDLGCGSGILSVAIAKLGATVLALDNDPIAVQSTQTAVQRNGVESQVTVIEGSLGRGSDLGHWMGGTTQERVPTIAPAADFDLIAANIFARVHIALASDFCQALRPSGMAIAAGFTIDYADEVTKAFTEAGFEEVDRVRSQEWIALAYRLTTS